jgi:hypothetical protein
MHDRSPAVRKPKRRRKRTAHEREQDRARKREQREREDDGTITFPGRCSPAFIEAMKARAIFFGASKPEAERDADDPKKIAALAFDILDDWAPNWYQKK